MTGSSYAPFIGAGMFFLAAGGISAWAMDSVGFFLAVLGGVVTVGGALALHELWAARIRRRRFADWCTRH